MRGAEKGTEKDALDVRWHHAFLQVKVAQDFTPSHSFGRYD